MPVYIVVDKEKDIKAAFLSKADAERYIRWRCRVQWRWAFWEAL